MTVFELQGKISEMKVMVYDRSRLIQRTSQEIEALNQQILLLEQEEQAAQKQGT